MPRNEEGEFEITVGTRQLLTMIFILMVLFGVVFSMGYFVGRSAGPETPPASVAKEAVPTLESAAKPPAGSGVSPLEAPAQPLAPGEAVAGPASTGPESTPVPEAAKPPAGAESKPPPAPAPLPLIAQPAPGQTFLQVAAVPRPEAELMVKVLKERAVSTLIVPVPDESTLFRVLVGPLADTASIAKAKADLEQAGFRSVIIRKY